MNTKRNEKGSALILVMILILVISVMAASMMFLAQSETWASVNYRLMTQARYAAETGIHAGANFLMYSYVPPDNGTDLLASYKYQGVTPVVLATGSSPVQLSSIPGDTPVYADGTVISLYASNTKGPLTAGSTTLNFASRAKLLGMRQINVFGKSQPATVQTWQITGRGWVASAQNAQVEVSAVMERLVTPMFAYAAFAANSGCGALTFGGGATTNSYNSSNIVFSSPTVVDPSTFSAYGGNVGTNGNLTELGSNTQIYGSLSTPRTGVGNCSSGNITALTGNTSQVSGGIIELPQPVTYPTPDLPNPLPPTSGTVKVGPNCSYAGGCSGAGTTANPYIIPPTLNANGTLNTTTCASVPCTYPTLSIGSNTTVGLVPGTYNVDCINFSSGGSITMLPDPVTGKYGQVIFNVLGTGCTGNYAIDMNGGSVTNPTYNPSNFQFLYAGSNLVRMTGGAESAALLYAPNASASFASASGDFYGSVIANQITDMGGAAIHYDRQLQRTLFNLGAWMLNSFSWSKF